MSFDFALDPAEGDLSAAEWGSRLNPGDNSENQTVSEFIGQFIPSR